MRKLARGTFLFSALAATACAQSLQNLVRDGMGGSIDSVLTYGMG